jgi:hypothetical protein
MALSAADYDERGTELCERAFVTVIGGAGFWGRSLYLVGGLVPRYLVGAVVPPTPAHVGSRDVDLAVAFAVDGFDATGYETLERNLRDGGFRQAPNEGDPEFRWRRTVEGRDLVLEFLCDTDEVPEGRNFRPRSGAGSRFQAFNVAGVRLLPADHRLVEVEAERLDGGGLSRISIRVAGLATFVTLKIRAFVDRHHDKDAYDLVYTLLDYGDGPGGAGTAIAASPVIGDALVIDALERVRERFAEPGHDGPASYARFLGSGLGEDAVARLRNEAVEAVRIVLAAVERGTGTP